jgi:DNA-binding beta-propeller fold protein YncE
VYVLEVDNQRIQKFTPEGVFITQYDLEPLFNGNPGTGRLAVCSEDLIYIYFKHDIYIFSLSEGIQTVQTSVDVWEINGIWADRSSGVFYVSDYDRVRKFDSSGDLLMTLGQIDNYGDENWIEPQDVSVDKQGNIWVSDCFRKQIIKYSPEGKYLTILKINGFSALCRYYCKQPAGLKSCTTLLISVFIDVVQDFSLASLC